MPHGRSLSALAAALLLALPAGLVLSGCLDSLGPESGGSVIIDPRAPVIDFRIDRVNMIPDQCSVQWWGHVTNYGTRTAYDVHMQAAGCGVAKSTTPGWMLEPGTGQAWSLEVQALDCNASNPCLDYWLHAVWDSFPGPAGGG